MLSATAAPHWQRLQPACLKIGRRRPAWCRSALQALRCTALMWIQAKRGYTNAWSESPWSGLCKVLSGCRIQNLRCVASEAQDLAGSIPGHLFRDSILERCRALPSLPQIHFRGLIPGCSLRLQSTPHKQAPVLLAISDGNE